MYTTAKLASTWAGLFPEIKKTSKSIDIYQNGIKYSIAIEKRRSQLQSTSQTQYRS